MSNNIKLIKKEDFIITNWSGGKTTQIYIYPEDANYKNMNFKFRISSATVELDQSEFTKLDEVYRFITPLDKKLKLTHNHKDFIELAPFEVYGFDGGLDTTSYGIAKDFNLMLANGAVGSLISIYIDKEYILETSEIITQSSINAIWITICPIDDNLIVEFDGITYILKSMETLIISSTDKITCSIKMQSTNPVNSLVSIINI